MPDQLSYEQTMKEAAELENQVRLLEEVNGNLRASLQQVRDECRGFEQRLVSNVETLVLPYIKMLTGTSVTKQQRVYLSVIEANLTELVAPFARKLGDRHTGLTAREIEVASLVRKGSTSREIAETLQISKRAVDFYRDSLRRKLRLKKSKVNLRAYLTSFG